MFFEPEKTMEHGLEINRISVSIELEKCRKRDFMTLFLFLKIE